MKIIALAENAAADAVAAQAWVQCAQTPFLPGFTVVGGIYFSGNLAAAGTFKIQSCPDQGVSAITDQMVCNTIIGKEGAVTLDNYMRANCTGAGTAGSKYSAYLYADN